MRCLNLSSLWMFPIFEGSKFHNLSAAIVNDLSPIVAADFFCGGVINIALLDRSLYYFMDPDALYWQNWFGPSKNVDKSCRCRSFNLSSVGALQKHSKIFVRHNYQSLAKNTIACALFTEKDTCDLRSNGLMVIFNLFYRTCLLGILLIVF